RFAFGFGVVEPLDRQDRGLPVDAGDACAVAADRPQDPRDVRTVPAVCAVLVERTAGFGEDAVAVGAFFTLASNAAARSEWFAFANPSRVRPDVGREIRMFVVDARVPLADDALRATGRQCPSIGCAGVCERRSG